jgi:hypothetical protein
MSAVEAIKAARIAGVRVALDGEDLVLEAQSQPSPTLLDALSQHKAEIIKLLQPGRDGWSAERLIHVEQSAGSPYPRRSHPKAIGESGRHS